MNSAHVAQANWLGIKNSPVKISKALGLFFEVCDAAADSFKLAEDGTRERVGEHLREREVRVESSGLNEATGLAQEGVEGCPILCREVGVKSAALLALAAR